MNSFRRVLQIPDSCTLKLTWSSSKSPTLVFQLRKTLHSHIKTKLTVSLAQGPLRPVFSIVGLGIEPKLNWIAGHWDDLTFARHFFILGSLSRVRTRCGRKDRYAWRGSFHQFPFWGRRCFAPTRYTFRKERHSCHAPDLFIVQLDAKLMAVPFHLYDSKLQVCENAAPDLVLSSTLHDRALGGQYTKYLSNISISKTEGEQNYWKVKIFLCASNIDWELF